VSIVLVLMEGMEGMEIQLTIIAALMEAVEVSHLQVVVLTEGSGGVAINAVVPMDRMVLIVVTEERWFRNRTWCRGQWCEWTERGCGNSAGSDANGRGVALDGGNTNNSAALLSPTK